VRTVSLWQPHATLVARALKLNETRSWEIDYRGPLAIHASKRKYKPAEYPQELRTQMLMDGVDSYGFVYGAVLCIVDVVDCVRASEIRERLSPRELIYGNYDETEGPRFAWVMNNVRVLPKPVELVGHQGIFHWADGERVLAECF
jgi:hypothetical protein